MQRRNGLRRGSIYKQMDGHWTSSQGINPCGVRDSARIRQYLCELNLHESFQIAKRPRMMSFRRGVIGARSRRMQR